MQNILNYKLFLGIKAAKFSGILLRNGNSRLVKQDFHV